jgi:uncharacterized protein (TIGR02118 family)
MLRTGGSDVSENRGRFAMTKVVFMLLKRPDWSREEFGAYWRGEHVAIARHVPGLRRYVQNHFLPESIQGEPPCDGVAELWFDSAEAFQQALATPEGQATLADLPRFCDPARSMAVLAEEHTVL